MRLQHFSLANGRHKRRLPQNIIGAALVLGLTAAAFAPQAKAANIRLGNIDVQVDTTVSAGLTMLTSERDKQFLPISNGGPADGSVYGDVNAASKAVTQPAQPTPATVQATLAAVGPCNEAYGGYCQELISKPNFDGSINTDDGRLNFDDGDLVSAPFKITSEFEAQSGAWTGFARVSAFYDGVLMDDGSFERGGLSDKGQSRAGQNLYLLDAYVDYDGDVGDMPFTIRAGRQVINWGEATFIPGGNSAFSPIDVAAIRRPGAEIKEALLPVEALYGSIALTQDFTLEAYVGGWDDYRLDAGGTLFGGSDVFTPGTKMGNPHNVYYIGGGYRSGDQFACNGDTALGALFNADNSKTYYGASAQIIGAIKGITGAVKCTGNPKLDATARWTTGKAESERAASGDTAIVRGLSNDDGSDSYGLALRWYAENLNSTEFAFYYQNVDSRLPYISYRTGKADIRAGSVHSQSSTVARGAGLSGCVAILTNSTNIAAGTPGAKAYNAAYATMPINDSKNLLSNSNLQAIANSAVPAVGGLLNVVSQGAITSYARSAPVGDNVAYMQETICLLNFAQGNNTVGSSLTALDDVGQLHTGATNLAVTPNIGLFAEYPEVEIIGFSFNTTLFGWGVQGDFTHRPDMPLQLDTDALTISALFNNCAFATVGGLEGLYQSGATYANEFGTIGCTDKNRYLRGYTTKHDAMTWDIGTTATFTRSNPVVNFLGADLGILLTEFQGVIVDDIEDKRGNTGGITALGQTKGITPLTNVCQGGSDLPLNGILSIDDRTVGDASNPNDNTQKGFCRPTDSSWGAVLFAQLQYNNAFGTPLNINPTLVINEGIEGYSPSPLGFWSESVGSTSVRIDASYLNAWQFSLAYTDYNGDKERTRNLDRNTMSLSASYAF